MLKIVLLALLGLPVVASAAHLDAAVEDCASYLVHGSRQSIKRTELRRTILPSGRALYALLDTSANYPWSFDIIQRSPQRAPKKLTVLLHGLGESHFSMMGIAKRLKEEKRDLLMLELPYHGQQFFDLYQADPSGIKLDSIRYQETIEDLSELVKQVASQNHYTEVELVGHSLGGGLVTFLIEKLSTQIRVSDAFLINPYFESLDQYHTREFANRLVPGGGNLLNFMNLFTPHSIKSLVYDMTVLPYLQSQLPGQARRDLDVSSLGIDEKKLLRLKTLVIEKTITGSREMNVTNILHQIPRQTRIHILRSDNDKLLPADYHDLMYNKMKQAGLFVTYSAIKGSHMAVIEKPDSIGLWILQNGQ